MFMCNNVKCSTVKPQNKIMNVSHTKGITKPKVQYLRDISYNF